MTEKEKLAAALARKPSVLFAYLFGSRVKGYAVERSDWDVAVYFDNTGKADGWPVFELGAELSREMGADVQVIALDEPLPPLLGYEIVSQGEELINRDEEKSLEVAGIILARYLDWQYYEERHMKTAMIGRNGLREVLRDGRK